MGVADNPHYRQIDPNGRRQPLMEYLCGHPAYPPSKGAHKTGKKGKRRARQRRINLDQL